MQELTIAKQKKGFLDFSNFENALECSKLIAQTEFAGAYRNRPHDIMIAIQTGMEVGLTPMQSLQNICVINGKPSVWGDAMLALCKGSAEFEYIKEVLDIETKTAYCFVKRKGQPEHKSEFSWGDATNAGLTNKSGPWKTYPKRMLQMRARGFALRDVFPDVLRGIISVEEARDYPRKSNFKDIEVEVLN